MSASKQDLGPASKHIQQSRGADTDLTHFYITQNSTTYGRKFQNFAPRTGKHTGTGYASNFRPQVYYSSRLDSVDNPSMGRIVSDNYHSVTEKSYRPYVGPTGTEVTPIDCKQNRSGFTSEKALAGIPRERQVRNTFIDSRSTSAPLDYRPRHKPLLHKLQPKDPIEAENFGYGPSSNASETRVKFQGDKGDSSYNQGKEVGPQEGSGFTHNKNVEPVTFHPDQQHSNERPGWYTNRPTGITVTTTDFGPFKWKAREEKIPGLVPRGDRDSGFVNSMKSKPEFSCRVMGDAYDKASDQPELKADKIRKNDPAEYINMQQPNNYSSVSKNVYLGRQNNPQTLPELLNTKGVGWKENTGFSSNELTYGEKPDNNTDRFITHYQTKFIDRTPVGKAREGHTWGDVQEQWNDGFTKSTSVHKFGADINTSDMIHNRPPYQARSTVARDPFFDDHTYDSKMHIYQRSMQRAS